MNTHPLELIHDADFAIPITDSHCHLSMLNEQYPEFLGLLRDFSMTNDILLLDIGVHPEDFPKRQELLCGLPTHLSVGIHPCWSQHFEVEQAENALRPHIEHAVAIGEIGLDWYRMTASKALQEEIFRLQVELAKEFDRPIIIHSRESLDDILSILEESKITRARGAGIMHCFSGTAAQARRCLELGFYISFSANVSYNSANDIRDALQVVPNDLFLIETDSPYILHKELQRRIKKDKHKKKYNRANTPLYLYYLMESIATIRGRSPLHISECARKNLTQLLNL